MTEKTVLISGASIAGPALALGLSRNGYRVTVVERAAALRPGGQAVDFKGEVHHEVLRRMGILDEVYARQLPRTDIVIVDAEDRPQATIPGEFIGGDVEIGRGDLAELLYERTRETCEYLFGDSITGLTETADGVDVTFTRAAPRTFDLVVGADGIHSAVRRSAFGPEADHVAYLGYYYAVVDGGTDDATSDARRAGTGYNEPGRMVWTGGPKAAQMYVFAASEPIDYDRYDPEAARQIVRRAFAGAGWRIPQLLDEMDAHDCFLDSFGRVTMDSYVRGRVALVGDSAYGNTLGGFGTGLAIVGAHILAGELARADGDHRVAFARYDELMHRYAEVARKASAGPFLAPPTPMRIRLRNWTFKFPPLLTAMMKLTDRFATNITLPDYPPLPR